MKQHQTHVLFQVIGLLLKTVLKLVGVTVLFACKILSLVFGKISEFLENKIGYGADH